MSFLFWMLWIVNLMLLLLAMLGKGFRSGFGAGIDFNTLVIISLLIVLAGSLIFRFTAKQKWISVVVVSLPLLATLVMYLLEKYNGDTP